MKSVVIERILEALIPPLPSQLALILAPCGVLFAYRWSTRRATSDPATMRSAVACGAKAASLAVLFFSLYVLYAIAASRSSTAILGILAIPFGGTPLFLVTFVLGWSIAVIGARRRAAGLVSTAAVASALLTVSSLGAVFVANAYTRHLVSGIETTASPDRLRTLAHAPWGRWDPRIHVAIARNESLPEDLVRELSAGPDRVQTMLASNPRTPFDVLLRMSETSWSAAATIANSDAPEVTPAVLRTIATGRFGGSLAEELAANPRTPPELADELRERIRLGRGAAAARRFGEP